MTDFGAKLREARERRGVSLRQIAETTKISMVALEALERNDLSRLPGGIFTRAIVRSYASEVGLNPDATVREFVALFDLDPGPVTLEAAAAESVGVGGRYESGAFLKLFLATLVIAAIILVLVLAKNQDNRSAAPSPADPERRTSRRGAVTTPKGPKSHALRRLR